VTVKYDGVLLGVGGHMHDYGRQIVLQDASRKETVATLDAKSDAQGHLESVPVKLFVQEGGYKFAKGDVLRVSATYDNPTGKLLRDGAMGIAVGYFAAADDVKIKEQCEETLREEWGKEFRANINRAVSTEYSVSSVPVGSSSRKSDTHPYRSTICRRVRPSVGAPSASPTACPMSAPYTRSNDVVIGTSHTRRFAQSMLANSSSRPLD